MKALQMTDSIPRYLLSRAASRVKHDLFWGRFANLTYRDVDPPKLPNSEWVRIRTRYGGICGSDVSTITLRNSTSTTVFTSFPFTLGHENVGYVSELGSAVADLQIGQRVVVNPLLACATRGFEEPCEMCAAGKPNLCQRFDKGELSPGVMTGFCRDTGGSWSAEFVAHRSQVRPASDALSDEEAVLAEPFAVALHSVVSDLPSDDDTVLIIGAGIIGLCTIAAIRSLGSRARIVVTARRPFQAIAARNLGADLVFASSRGSNVEADLVSALGAEALTPVLGDDVIVGGAHYVYDCVGSAQSLQTAFNFARSTATVVVIGLVGAPKSIDWTPVWMNELTIRGDFCYAVEDVRGGSIDSIGLAMRLMADKSADLGSLVTHRFALDDFQHALSSVTGKGRSGVIKAVFEFDAPDTAMTSAPGE